MPMNFKIKIIFAVLLIIVSGGSVNAQEAKDWFQKGNELSREDRFADAVEAYQQSLTLNPNATVVHYNLGLAYKKLRQYTKAVDALKKAVDLEPNYLEAHLALGNVYNLMERWEDAIAHLTLVVHNSPNDAEAYGNLGWAYYNYKSGPPFKFLVIINLEKAVQLFEEQGLAQAAEATRKILEEALIKFGFDSDN